MRLRALFSLFYITNILQWYTQATFGPPLGGCMDILARVMFAGIFLSFICAKASKPTIMTVPCLLTCPAMYFYGKSFSIDIHTATDP